MEATKQAMRPEVLQEWILALESGSYQKEKGTLKGTVGFCCLGVLSDLCPDWNWEELASDDCYETSILPYPVAEWAGSTGDLNGEIYLSFPWLRGPLGDTCDTPAHANDFCADGWEEAEEEEEEASFSDIARALRNWGVKQGLLSEDWGRPLTEEERKARERRERDA